MIRIRRLGWLAAIAAWSWGASAAWAPVLWAAPEVHRFSLVLSSIPTQVSGGDFNDQVDATNVFLELAGFEPLDRITFAWLHEAQLRFFVRQNVAVNFGVGQLKNQTKREYLFTQNIFLQIRGEVFSVPIHAGVAYYLQPYTQGDFQARAYLGGGFMALVGNRATFQTVLTDPTSGFSTVEAFVRDSPGYYVEMGGHMFFASRYSVLLGVIYRSAVIRQMLNRETHQPVFAPDGEPFTLDVSGVGARMGVGIGF